jgi:hypothetical protein
VEAVSVFEEDEDEEEEEIGPTTTHTARAVEVAEVRKTSWRAGHFGEAVTFGAVL